MALRGVLFVRIVLLIPSSVSTPAGVLTGDVESMRSQISLPATAMRVLVAVEPA